MAKLADPPNPPRGDDLLPALCERLLEELRERRGGRTPSLREWMATAEAWWICRALGECRGNRSAAARVLGIGRRTLYAKLDRYGIEPEWRFGGWARREAGAVSNGRPDPA